MIPNIKQLTPFLTLKTVNTDKFKTERFSVTIEIKPDKRLTPISRFVFSVLKRGCKKYQTQQELNIRLDELYSTTVTPFFFAGAGLHRIGFVAEMLGDEYTNENLFEGVAELLFELLWNPLLDENNQFLNKYIESERENICDYIKSVINNPRLYAIKRFIEIMYDKDSYSNPTNGTVELINSVTAEELMETYFDLIHNSSYEVFYIGSKSSDDVESLVRKHFEKYGFGKAAKRPNAVDFEADTKKVKRVTEEMMLSQGKLVVGYKSGINITCDKDFYSMLVLNEIYGASPISKLFMNVRERLGLCYYCSSAYNAHKGFLYVSSGIEKSDLKKAENEIKKQLKEIQNGNISDLEFSSAKKSLLNGYSETEDSASSIEHFYMLREEYSVKDTIEDAKRKIKEVTVNDVVRVSKNLKLDTVYFLSPKDGDGCDD